MTDAPVFHPPTLADKPWIDAVLAGTDPFNSVCAFGTVWLWRRLYQTETAAFDGCMLLRGRGEDGTPYYMYPMGNAYSVRDAVGALRADAARQGVPLVMYGVEAWQLNELTQAFPDTFEAEPARWDCDYIYRSADLIALEGKKYHAKRNHIHRFVSLYPDWRYEDIHDANRDECAAMAAAWMDRALASADTDAARRRELLAENAAIVEALGSIPALGLAGGLLRVGGRVVAMTLGEPLCGDVFDIHFEKADTDYEGAYAVINREFAAHRLAGYTYINREEDLGIEGLRKAKLSYHPVRLVEKYVVKS